MTTIAIRPRRESDDPRIVDIQNSVYSEMPAMSVFDFRHRLELDSKIEHGHQEHYVALCDEQVAGVLAIQKEWEVARPNVWWVDLETDPSLRQRGIGSRLYEHAMQRAEALLAARVYSEVPENVPEAKAFAERRGFALTGRSDRMSKLNVHTADLGQHYADEERLRVEGLRVVPLAKLDQSEHFLRQVYDVESSTVQDVPSSEERTNSWPFDPWRTEMLTGPGRSAASFFVALDGDQPVGAARLKRRGENAAFNSYTCVASTHRGRGVARVLKLHTILWARENGVDYIYTGNDVDNKRMLDINVKLGYEPIPSLLEVVKILRSED